MFDQLKAEAVRLDRVMLDDLEAVGDETLKEVLKHSLLAGGKRVRPLLTVFGARLAGFKEGAVDELYRLAMVFEYIHAASLLHDDVIDRAELRRGKPSANIIWGTTPVILAGDYLHARAMLLAGSIGGTECLEILAGATSAMVEAEFLQARIAGGREISEEKYFEVLKGKTSALIAAACEAGVLYAGGTADQRQALRTYGVNLGLAFQVVDDLLDYLGDSEKTGKVVGNDFVEGKMTLPLIYGFQNADKLGQDAVMDLLAGNSLERKDHIQTVRNLIEINNGFELAGRKARELVDAAVASLKIFPSMEAGEILSALAGYVLTREK